MLDIICTRKEKNMGIFIFQVLQNGVKHIILQKKKRFTGDIVLGIGSDQGNAGDLHQVIDARVDLQHDWRVVGVGLPVDAAGVIHGQQRDLIVLQTGGLFRFFPRDEEPVHVVFGLLHLHIPRRSRSSSKIHRN